MRFIVVLLDAERVILLTVRKAANRAHEASVKLYALHGSRACRPPLVSTFSSNRERSAGASRIVVSCSLRFTPALNPVRVPWLRHLPLASFRFFFYAEYIFALANARRLTCPHSGTFTHRYVADARRTTKSPESTSSQALTTYCFFLRITYCFLLANELDRTASASQRMTLSTPAACSALNILRHTLLSESTEPVSSALRILLDHVGQCADFRL